MSKKQEIIQEMITMQRKFIQLEQRGDFSAAEYYDSNSSSELATYKERYNTLAIQLVDVSHDEKGSHR